MKMANIFHKILKQTVYFGNWKHVIKNGFKLAYFLRSSQELKLEELQMKRVKLETRAQNLMQKQRSAESMLTDLTRSIKQMEFDFPELKKLVTGHENVDVLKKNTSCPESERDKDC